MNNRVDSARCVSAVVLLAACQLLAACSSDSGGSDEKASGSELIAGAAEGIYRLDASTLNESGCDAEGPSRLDTMQTKFAYLVNDEGGSPFVEIGLCLDVAQCRELRRQSETSSSGGLDTSIVIARPSGGLGRDTVTGNTSVVNGQCVGGTLSRLDLSVSGKTFELKRRISSAPSHAPDLNGGCYDATGANLGDVACEQYRVYHGTFVEAL